VIRDDRVKVLDFGLAMVLAAESETAPNHPQSLSSRISTDSNLTDEDATLAAFPFGTLSPGTIPTSLTKTGAVMGTPGYMSPEQAMGDPVGKSTDIWAFGCCLFEALTGSRAFEGETFQQAVVATLTRQPDWAKLEHIPTILRDLIHHCLAQNPDERVGSFTDVLSRLRVTQLGTPGPKSLDVPPTPQSLEQRLFDMSLDMLCVAGIDGFLKRVNPAFERTLGWRARELYSRPFVDFIHEEDREETLLEMGRLAEGNSTLSFSNRYRCRDGTYCRLYWTAEVEPGTGLIYGVARFSPGSEDDEGFG
jgi:PAS domain S-box-containing protein